MRVHLRMLYGQTVPVAQRHVHALVRACVKVIDSAVQEDQFTEPNNISKLTRTFAEETIRAYFDIIIVQATREGPGTDPSSRRSVSLLFLPDSHLPSLLSPTPALSPASHAKLAGTGRSQSVDLDDHQKPEFRRVFSSSIIENGHRSSSSGQAKAAHELTSFQMSESSSPEAHAPAVTLQMPHLPVTAVTRTSEKFSGENICSTGTINTSSCLLGQGKSTNTMGVKPSNQPVKDWNSVTMRTVDSSATGENATSATKSVSTVDYGLRSGTKTGESAIDSYCDVTVTPSSHSPPPTVRRQVERRRELVRSQTLPRTIGTQARKALFEKFERDDGKGKGESRAKLKRSLSFGVASASSIKQILLDWCRSKTIGYKHIDLQNFSSSWNDGMAFCALVHSFFPEAFDYNKLDPANRKQNFELAFTTAEKMAHCDRLIEVEDMMVMGHKPDPMCVFTYVQSLYSHLRHFE
ncbi:PREDICTED: smoothelin-like protein 2 [Corvus brachyrhynchos]|uniref:smoothelin-like protein 2 n=1 Tax=Corvus brachyrhynchos TaxID=85066 RepID=UPI000816750C|nr:PREDICTED: smoothelin-like protein 2 [Corvus brachyrhynchos]